MSEVTSKRLCDRFEALLNSDPGVRSVTATPFTFEGEDYIITQGTGDGSYAYEPGDFGFGVAAIESSDFDDRYQSFVDATSGIANWERFARAVQESTGIALNNPGDGSVMSPTNPAGSESDND